MSQIYKMESALLLVKGIPLLIRAEARATVPK
jgi:hypothetical protein